MFENPRRGGKGRKCSEIYSLSIRPSYGVRGEEISFFPFSPETPDTQATKSRSLIAFRTDIFRKLTLGAPV